MGGRDGGGMGRPVELSGGRDDGARFSPSPEADRWVGRIVVGPSGVTVRVGGGLGTAARVRTTRVGSEPDSLTVVVVVGEKGLSTGGRVATGGDGISGGGLGATSSLAGAAFLVVGSSGWTSRRRPSLSALRRTRSACASSMDDDALLTPMPRVWERSSSSLLVMPSSRASSCTRIFFVAKTFLHLRAAREGLTHVFPSLSQFTVRLYPIPHQQLRY